MPDGTTEHITVFMDGSKGGGVKKRKWGYREGEGGNLLMKRINAKKLNGYQLRYIYFLNKEARARLTVPIIPFSKIDEMGASMYKGESIKRDTKATTSDQLVGGGAIPTITLHSPYAASKKTNEA